MLSTLRHNICDMLEALITGCMLDAFGSSVEVFSTASTTDFMRPGTSVLVGGVLAGVSIISGKVRRSSLDVDHLYRGETLLP